MPFKERAISIVLNLLAPFFGAATFTPPIDQQITELQTLEPGWTGRWSDGTQAMFNQKGQPVIPTGSEVQIGVDYLDLNVRDYRARPGHQGGVQIDINGSKQVITEVGIPTPLTYLPGATVIYHGPTSNSNFPKK